MRVLLFAHFYILDSAINAAYTAVFATSWFLVLSQGERPGGAGERIDEEHAGFTSQAHTMSQVAVSSVPGAGGVLEQRLLTGVPADGSDPLGAPPLQPESFPSIGALVSLLVVKVYFTLVVLAYARRLVIRMENGTAGDYVGWKRQVYKSLTRTSYWNVYSDLLVTKRPLRSFRAA